MPAVTSIMLVDDHEIVRAGFRRLLDTAPDFKVIAEASSGEEAYRTYLKLMPDVVVMDLSMPPGAGGLAATQRIRAADENAQILVLTVQECEPYPSRVMESGALGYLTKRCAPEELLEAVRHVSQGEKYIAMDVREGMNDKGDKSGLRGLTRRELQIFTQLAAGMSAADVATAMHISQKTVHAHRSNIVNKLGIRNTSDLVHYAIRHGVIQA